MSSKKEEKDNIISKLLSVRTSTVNTLLRELTNVDLGFKSFKKYGESILEVLGKNPELLQKVNKAILLLNKEKKSSSSS